MLLSSRRANDLVRDVISCVDRSMNPLIHPLRVNAYASRLSDVTDADVQLCVSSISCHLTLSKRGKEKKKEKRKEEREAGKKEKNQLLLVTLLLLWLAIDTPFRVKFGPS